jgi:hypothetical protein
MPTITRVYDAYSDADRVVREIEAIVPSSEISLIANRYVREEFGNVEHVAGTGAGMGAALGGSAGLLAALGVIAIPGLGPVVAAGWLASTAVCALAGAAAGGLIGALIGSGMSEEDANVYAEIVRRGGTLVTVRTEPDLEARVREIMDRYDPIDANARRAHYMLSGWSRFDPSAKPYMPSTMELERIRRHRA